MHNLKMVMVLMTMMLTMTTMTMTMAMTTMTMTMAMMMMTMTMAMTTMTMMIVVVVIVIALKRSSFFVLLNMMMLANWASHFDIILMPFWCYFDVIFINSDVINEFNYLQGKVSECITILLKT